MTGTFPTRVVLEKVLFGGDDRGAVGTVPDGIGAFDEGVCFAPGRSSPATVSWRS